MKCELYAVIFNNVSSAVFHWIYITEHGQLNVTDVVHLVSAAFVSLSAVYIVSSTALRCTAFMCSISVGSVRIGESVASCVDDLGQTGCLFKPASNLMTYSETEKS